MVSEVRDDFHCIFGHETWPLTKDPEVAHIISFYPSGSKLSLFSLYGQRFSRYRPIFKLAIFEHETWPLARVPEVAHILFFYPMRSKLSVFFALRTAVSEIRADFHNNIVIFGHETWPLAKVPEVAHIISFYPPEGQN